MNVLEMVPPFYDRIRKAFPIDGLRVIFTFGRNIYNPGRIDIPRELYAHEAVHCVRQGGSWEQIADWWERYLIDPEFRFIEELPAYQAEYRAYVRRHGPRKNALRDIAAKLCGPVYGNVCTLPDAMSAIIEHKEAA